MKAVFMTKNGPGAIHKAYSSETQSALTKELCFSAPIYSKEELEKEKAALQEVHYIFSTWGMLPLTEEEIRGYFPQLKAVFYAAGSVQEFARSFLACGVAVFSAWMANAVPVAEYTVAQILLAGKGFYQCIDHYRASGFTGAREYASGFPGNYGAKIGVLGAGAIGKLVIQMLKSYKLEVLVFDPFLSVEGANALGVQKAGLSEIFSGCKVISNHIANNPQTVGMLDYSLFSVMQPYATFLNTGRGAQVVEPDLIRAMTEVPTRTAVLDVTFPEPVPMESPLLHTSNIYITPHIAGSSADEIARMGEYMQQEFISFAAGGPGRYRVTEEMLKTMA